jgi:hypothetical protein
MFVKGEVVTHARSKLTYTLGRHRNPGVIYKAGGGDCSEPGEVVPGRGVSSYSGFVVV